MTAPTTDSQDERAGASPPAWALPDAASEKAIAESRRLQNLHDHLAVENRRLRKAVDQMRAEITVLNELLEPLHSMSEQMEQQRRNHDNEKQVLRAEFKRQDRMRHADLQRRESEMDAALQRRDAEAKTLLTRRDAELTDSAAKIKRLEAELQGMRTSKSWALTRPWRAFGHAVGRLKR